MSDALKNINLRATPQTEKARPEQVKNSAGGFVFAVDKWDQLDRFLILGTDKGTYYASERDHTMKNFEAISKLIAEDGVRVVRRVIEISDAGRAPKNDQAIFVLALASVQGDEKTRRAAYDNLRKVCRTSTHLFQFLNYRKNLSGGVSRGLRTSVGNWYLTRNAQQLSLQMVKYRQRDGWTHRDVLRIAHPKAESVEQKALFDFACGRLTDPDQVPENLTMVRAFLRAQKASSAKEIVDLITAGNLPWEAIPDQFINEKAVWEALVSNGIGITALMRQLNRLTRIGYIAPNSAGTKLAVSMLTNVDNLRAGRVHPYNVLVAQRTYGAGRGFKGSTTWTPVSAITDALEDAFDLSFQTIEPSNKRTLIGLDVSGSMGVAFRDSFLTVRDAAAAMCLATVRTEPWTEVYGFTAGSGYSSRCGTAFTPLGFTKRTTLKSAVNKTDHLPFGATDCALPMLEATKNKWEVDTFIVYTDAETWAGKVQPFQALKDYRQKMGIDARLVVVGMVSNNFTIADPSDKGMLDVVGFDAAAPNLIASFSRGDF